MREPVFGELMRGTYASENNPERFGYYVRTIYRKGRMNQGKHYELTDKKGKFWEYPVDAVVLVEFISVSNGGPNG